MKFASLGILHIATLSVLLATGPVVLAADEVAAQTIVGVGLSGNAGTGGASTSAAAEVSAAHSSSFESKEAVNNAAGETESHHSIVSFIHSFFGKASAEKSENADATVISGVRADAQVSHADASEKEVSLTYLTHAKLFGFIPLTTPVEATVDAKGSVSLHYPWYGIFLSSNNATLKTKIQSAVDATLTATSTPGAQLSANEQALLLQEVHAIMQTELQATSSAKASADL
jgi:hypothetical protein